MVILLVSLLNLFLCEEVGGKKLANGSRGCDITRDSYKGSAPGQGPALTKCGCATRSIQGPRAPAFRSIFFFFFFLIVYFRYFMVVIIIKIIMLPERFYLEYNNLVNHFLLILEL